MEHLLDPEGNSTSTHDVLPEHLAAGLTSQEQVEDYADHISKINREYTPLSCAIIPERVAYPLDNDCCKDHPSLEDHEVFNLLKARKVTGGVDGDLDPRVVKACLLTQSLASTEKLLGPMNGQRFGRLRSRC